MAFRIPRPVYASLSSLPLRSLRPYLPTILPTASSRLKANAPPALRHGLSSGIRREDWANLGANTNTRLTLARSTATQDSKEQENKLHKDKVEDIKAGAQQRAKAAQEEAQAASLGQGTVVGSVDTASVRKQLEEAIVHMQAGLVERDTEVRLLLLAALSGEHILFIGPPGTAKSELGRRLSRLYRGNFFERLLTRFSVPEELFGPLSMRALEDDQYVRQTQGYLPEAHVAFIDEIFKANSAILNTLLTILNERLFDNGSQRHRVPLLCMVGASNELPESEELDALYDRFLLRREVRQVSTAGLSELLADPEMVDVASGEGASSSARSEEGGSVLDMSRSSFENIRADAIKHVTVSDDVRQLLVDLRSHLQDKCEPPVYVSDRRLLKSVNIMKVAAYTSGRSSVSTYDCLLLQHVLWQRPDESERIADYVLSHLASDEKSLEQADYLFKGMFARACQLTSKSQGTAELQREVGQMRKMLVGKLASVYSSARGGPDAVAFSIWSSPEEADAVAAALAPKLSKAQEAVERLLYEVVTLEEGLAAADAEVVVLADALQSRWGDFIRSSDMDEVRPYGTRPAGKKTPAPFAQPLGRGWQPNLDPY